jgi:pimeloyl-ACP methyl ester carboxylesterase/chorismate mutase
VTVAETRDVEVWSAFAEREVDGEVVKVWSRGVPEPRESGGSAGRPVVAMAHGLEAGWRSWLPLADRLPAAYQICLLDLPWRSRGSYRWLHRGSGHWLSAALSLLPGRADVLVGHSFGSNAIVDHLAKDRAGGGDAPGAVVLTAPFHQSRPWVAGDPGGYEEFRRTFRHVLADGLRLSLGQRDRPLAPAEFDALLARVTEQIEGPGLRAVVDHLAASVGADLTRLTRPVLVVGGSRDPAATPAMATAMAADLPDGRHALIPGCGHFVHVEQPGPVAALIEEFLLDPLAGLRAEVDALDARIVDLLAARAEVVARIHRAKAGRVAARVPERDREVIARVRTRAVSAGIDPAIVESVYRAVIDAFVAWQSGGMNATEIRPAVPGGRD